jgi:predicted ATPase/DNA-binding SARP family transcriptional activator
LRHDREVERGWLAGTLWPESDGTTALTYLRQSLTDLRHALGEASPLLLSPSPRTLRLDIGNTSDGAELDLVSFARYLKRGDTGSLEQAVALYRGPLLEGWTEEWLLGEREACALAYLGALETLSRQAMETGENAAAVRHLRLLLAADPLRESASRSLMQALAATRDYGAMTQVYRELRLALRREVNAEPDAQTQALFAALRTEARRQAAEAPVVGHRTAAGTGVSPSVEHKASRSVSLPRPLSEFIGRMREVEAVKQALTASRLVTLMGIGGVGKTRLAIRVAEEVADDFPDGVRFVDLSPLADPEQVVRTVAATLSIAEQAGRDLMDSVCDHLRDRNLLLILDNCEHLLPECVRFTAALLQECPTVRLLATSRQRLGITGETVRSVPPLPLPDLKRLSDDDKNAASILLEYESVRLFVDRAQRVQPGLYLNEPTLRAIAAICSRLDGIPLALELAAARMSALGPEQIATRLRERLRLLSGSGSGDRSAPARQRTLRAALDWSYDLLLPEERVLLRRLSVFAGGWTLEAAEAVCIGNGLEDWEILDALTGLVDHSLVVVEPNSGRARYRLLETVREYAQERLQECPDDAHSALQAKHREYFLHLAREAAQHMSGAEQAACLDRLEQEHDNLRAAMDGCLAEGTAEALRIGLGLAGELQRFWAQRGYAGEGRRRYAALLSHDCATPTWERARALESASALAFRQGDYSPAREMANEARAIYRQTGDRVAEATPLNLLGSIAYVQGDYGEARSLLEQALALRREAGQLGGQAIILNYLGNITVEQGDFAEARTHYEQALAISREVKDPALEASILNGLGRLADFQDDYAGAIPWFEQALARNREIGDYSQMVVIIYNLGNSALALGDQTTAQEYFREALLLCRELGESRSRRLIAFLLKALAMTALPHSPSERAARLLGASDAQREAIGVPLNSDDQQEHDAFVARLRNTLGEEEFAARRDEGRAMRIDQAIAVALEQ